jgi:hypothetical protein
VANSRCADSKPLPGIQYLESRELVRSRPKFDKNQRVYVKEFELTDGRGSIDGQMEVEVCQVEIFEMCV